MEARPMVRSGNEIGWSHQYHNDPVKFRNIWVREVKPPVGHRTGPPFNLPAKPKTEEPKAESSEETKDDNLK